MKKFLTISLSGLFGIIAGFSTAEGYVTSSQTFGGASGDGINMTSLIVGGVNYVSPSEYFTVDVTGGTSCTLQYDPYGNGTCLSSFSLISGGARIVNPAYKNGVMVAGGTPVISVAFGKLKLSNSVGSDEYHCVYDKFPGTTSGFTNRFFYEGNVPSGFSCASTSGSAELVDFLGANPPPIPPLEPIVSDINGLTCQTDYIASHSGATWYDFGSLPNVFNADDPSVPDLAWIEVGNNGYDGDRDLIGWSPAGTGSLLGTGSFTYPGTSTGILLDPQSGFGNLYVDSIRGGNKTPYNIFQFFGTQNIAFGRAGTMTIEQGDGIQYGDVTLTSSGGTVVGALANTNSFISTLIVNYMGRFNGFRIGRGEMLPKTSCSINFNICEWSYEGANLECVSRQNAAGVDFAGCGLAGSGSIYGSGSCVPLTNASGSIIPPPPVTGGFVTLDGSGNVVGTVIPLPSGSTVFSEIFNCGIGESDDWWNVIGKALICPIKVIGNATKKMWDSFGGAQSSINQIGQIATRSYSGAQQDTNTGSSYTGSNVLLQSMMRIDEGIASNQQVNFWKYFAYFGAFVMVLAVMIGLLRKN